MAKKSFLFSVLLLLSVCVNAQIQRTVFGITIGSSIESAKKVVANKGLTFGTPSGGGSATMLPFDNPYFAGIAWSNGVIWHKDGIVRGVSFFKSSQQGLSLATEGGELLVSLLEKYGDYAKDANTDTDDPSKFKSVVEFTDDKTFISISIDCRQKGLSSVSLSYYDTKLVTEINQNSAKDDL